mgnify:CR=1 FL=1
MLPLLDQFYLLFVPSAYMQLLHCLIDQIKMKIPFIGVLLFNKKMEVAGYVNVSVKSEDGKVSEVSVNRVSICTVGDYEYAEKNAADLLNWTKTLTEDEKNFITYDEGMITFGAKIIKVEDYAKMIEIKFKAYEVCMTVDETQSNHADYEEDWGLPAGKGEFFMSIPNSWKLAE